VERTRDEDGERREGERWQSDGSTLPYVAWKEGKKKRKLFFFWSEEKEKMIKKIKIYHYAKI